MAVILMFFLFSLRCWSEDVISFIDHGVFGAQFDIAEEDMIEVLKGKLQKLQDSGKLEAIENEMKEKAKDALSHPAPVQGLKKTETERQFIHDPTLLIEADLKDTEGRVFAKKGDRINPLKTHKPAQGLLFIDGEDENQRQWAKEHKDQYIITLVKGSPLELEQEFGVPLYFDQGGYLCQHYKIKQIPARIDVTGDVLTIIEFKAEFTAELAVKHD